MVVWSGDVVETEFLSEIFYFSALTVVEDVDIQFWPIESGYMVPSVVNNVVTFTTNWKKDVNFGCIIPINFFDVFVLPHIKVFTSTVNHHV
ncbi:hypothetical protein PBCV1_a475R [Paramecium bursaria Chlorella virus 1]|uniref:Uncharacterized protein n=1 Tax=Paramecium bursaria Chlorella virus 1 TaxID=10506 RepID=Q98525_PBCV1|nr:hypothetical protein PBCV1_a475R [Paramecium bursaria Chlorella virus 1]AAC96842.1 hypothetical protein [Paramecium bursaria Chlorella virus 1]